MAQFGKNPPWARAANDIGSAAMGGVPNLQPPGVATPVLSQPGVATPTVYSLASGQPAMAQHQYTSHAQQQQLAAANMVQPQLQAPVLGQPGIAIPTSLATTQVATVSYPTPRAAQQAQHPQPKQRVFTGNVTKLHDNFGFVDEDVFFQSSCVKGMHPKVGDRVLVEATYNANMPFKWNATRIQVLPNQGASSGVGSQASSQQRSGPIHAGAAIPPPQQFHTDMTRAPPPLMGANTAQGLLPAPMGGRSNVQSQRGREVGPFRDRDRDRDRTRDRNERHERRERRSPRKRSRSPRRSRSPSSRTRSPNRRRATRIVPRYSVTVPKLSLDMREANVITLRSRYQNLYIPSDFFNASFEWTEAFPAHRGFQLGSTCTFQVMHKEVSSLEPVDTALDPSDADHLFSAKVMLLSCPPMDELYQKTCSFAGDPTDSREQFQHPTRLLQFLVGLKGKSEPMAIGGPWSPSLDGPNPLEDPCVLIKTAIRTTKALTGVDLSNCTQWYRFAEIRYHRPEELHKGRLVPARVETVVLFLPDVWSCMPSRLEWQNLQATYKQQLVDKLAQEAKEDTQEDDDEEEVEEKKEPTHYSELDPKSMKVGELRRELDNRSLTSKGLRSQLVARLNKAIKTEQSKEEEEAECNEEEEDKAEEEMETPEADDKEEERKKKEEEDRKRREERERAARERRYHLPDNPAIIVHPSSTAKSGRFDCTSMSLSVLLDYRPEDNKEHSFEVSLFAELFNEMLMRDFGFRIYKALLAAPEKKEEKKDKKDEDKDKKKEEKKEDTSDAKESKEDDKDKEEDSSTKEPSAKKRKSSKDEKPSKSEDGDEKKDGEDDDEDDNDKDDKDKEHRRKRDKVKYYTADKGLLLAFVYFDLTHTGYLLDKDMEEILHTIGLHLSRAQVKKLVQKLVTRDTVNYRKLTDKPVQKPEVDKPQEVKNEAPEAGSQNEAVKEEAGEPAEPKPDTEQEMEVKEVPLDDDEAVGLGNKSMLPPLVLRATKEVEVKKEPEVKGAETGQMRRTRSQKVEVEAGPTMVMYKGSMLDVNSVMQRLERSEKTRVAVEDKLKEIQAEITELKSNYTSSEQNSQKVALELGELKKKLRDHKKSAETAEANAKKYRLVLEAVNKQMAESTAAIHKSLGDGDSNTPTKVKVKAEAVKTEVNGEK